MPDSPYDVLSVPVDATPESIRSAYRALARQYHPDLNPGASAAQEFTRVSDAYSILSDADKRRKYDAVRKILEGTREEDEFMSSPSGSGWSGRVRPPYRGSWAGLVHAVHTMSSSAMLAPPTARVANPNPSQPHSPVIRNFSFTQGVQNRFAMKMIYTRQILTQANVNIIGQYHAGQTITVDVPGTNGSLKVTGIISNVAMSQNIMGDIEIDLEIIA